ncbi:MAG: hypothetical protein Q8N63_08365 [Nanoarchaeota archaeon]|nr:hypothetical protein [Nanoarchaeota archaeon]
MNKDIVCRKDKEIIEGLKTRVETLIGIIQEYAKKLNLDVMEGKIKNEETKY